MPHSCLYWRPVNHEGEYIGYELKFAISEYLFGHDGSLKSDWVEVNRTLIPFLKGVEAAAPQLERSQEAKKLIELIELHESIELSLKI